MDPREASLIEQRRRSLVKSPEHSPSGLKREEALHLIEELQNSQRTIVELERCLAEAEAERAVEEATAVRRHPAAGPPPEQP